MKNNSIYNSNNLELKKNHTKEKDHLILFLPFFVILYNILIELFFIYDLLLIALLTILLLVFFLIFLIGEFLESSEFLKICYFSYTYINTYFSIEILRALESNISALFLPITSGIITISYLGYSVFIYTILTYDRKILDLFKSSGKKGKFSIFISSTVEDLSILRQNIKIQLEKHRKVHPILTEFPETFPKSIDTTLDTFNICREAVKSSDIFVLLINNRYGNIDPKTGKSIVEEELNVAIREKKPKIVFIEDQVLNNYSLLEGEVSYSNDKEFRDKFFEKLKKKGYNNPKKLMNLISSLKKVSIRKPDNWCWRFSLNHPESLIKDLISQINEYLKQFHSPMHPA